MDALERRVDSPSVDGNCPWLIELEALELVQPAEVAIERNCFEERFLAFSGPTAPHAFFSSTSWPPAVSSRQYMFESEPSSLSLGLVGLMTTCLLCAVYVHQGCSGAPLCADLALRCLRITRAS